MHRRAFTFIELAIVLTIIAILAGVVVSQIVRARRAAREAACGFFSPIRRAIIAVVPIPKPMATA